MVDNNFIKKGLAIAIILLFIGLAFTPSINANVSKVSVDSELVEITTEVCGLNGGKHAVQITKEDALELEQLFDDIKRRLDEVATREEAVDVLNKAVVEIDKYGLLGGLNIEQAQWLVTRGYKNNKILKIFEKIYSKQGRFFGEDENRFCLVVGAVDGDSYFMSVWDLVLYVLHKILSSILDEYTLSYLFLFPVVALIYYNSLNPFCIGRSIRFYFDNVHGKIVTLGLNGQKVFEGNLTGLIDLGGFGTGAIVGFTGLKIQIEGALTLSLFLGFALWVKIKST